jgi:hypothetical protein
MISLKKKLKKKKRRGEIATRRRTTTSRSPFYTYDERRKPSLTNSFFVGLAHELY